MNLDLTSDHKELMKEVKINDRIYRGENKIRWKRNTEIMKVIKEE